MEYLTNLCYVDLKIELQLGINAHTEKEITNSVQRVKITVKKLTYFVFIERGTMSKLS